MHSVGSVYKPDLRSCISYHKFEARNTVLETIDLMSKLLNFESGSSSENATGTDAWLSTGVGEAINGNGLPWNAFGSKCAYSAGSVMIIYHMNLGNQSHLRVSNGWPKPFSCVALSQDGHFAAAGEAGN
ncbi:hypothetical protein VNO77_02430 [Canavalia gladiata]|uniref:Uncharacterized protein n=1 Tax=Canavalia gladiata TaxID=3824 RepID=A0AAN9R5Y1_CANGL